MSRIFMAKMSLAYLCVCIFLFPIISRAQSPTAEYLYDSVLVQIYKNYTADILYKKSIRFNQAGVEKYSIIRVPVNQHIDFKLREVTTRLPDGRQLRLDDDKIETISDFSARYYPESKTKIIYIPSPREGAISDISYNLRYNSLLYLPRFFRQNDITTYNSYFEVKSEIPYTYFVSNSLEVGFREDSTLMVLSPVIPSLITEPHMPPPDNFQILIKPDSASYMGKKYGFPHWPDVAQFYNEISELNSSDEISPTIVTLADSLVESQHSRDDSLAALLDYVLENIRYISMDIGRGEFKPLAASEVLSKRYGDCKDQSALLVAMCRAVGLEADPALMVTRNKPDVIIPMPWPGFFNHVITAVDTGNGYLFLDASQTTCCFGNLPFSLRNRRALICGSSPFLEFTLTSPFGGNNDINIDMTYIINGSKDMRVDVTVEMLRDPAHVFTAPSDQQALSNIIYSLFGEEIPGRYRGNFRVEENQSDYIKINGVFYESLPEVKAGESFLIAVQSPYLKILKNYFTLPKRLNHYQFDYAFNVNEKINFVFNDEYSMEKDSLVLAFNERGLNAELDVLSNDSACYLSKTFKLFDYSLSADRYNRFVDFLLIASQIGYNSLELTRRE